MVGAPLEPQAHVVPIEGVFDPAAAADMTAQCAATDCERVVLDFSRAREVSDLGLAIVVAAMRSIARPQVLLRGLRHHQERQLRYLGIEGG